MRLLVLSAVFLAVSCKTTSQSALQESPSLTRNLVQEEFLRLGYEIKVDQKYSDAEQVQKVFEDFAKKLADLKGPLDQFKAEYDKRYEVQETFEIEIANLFRIESPSNKARFSIDADQYSSRPLADIHYADIFIRMLELAKYRAINENYAQPKSERSVKKFKLRTSDVETFVLAPRSHFELFMKNIDVFAEFIRQHPKTIDALWISNDNWYDPVYRLLILDISSPDFPLIFKAVRNKDYVAFSQYFDEH